MYGEHNANGSIRLRVILLLITLLAVTTLIGCLHTYYYFGPGPHDWPGIESQGFSITFFGGLWYVDSENPSERTMVDGEVPADSANVWWFISCGIYQDRWPDSLIFVIDTISIIPEPCCDTLTCAEKDTLDLETPWGRWQCPRPSLLELNSKRMQVRLIFRSIRIDGARPPERHQIDFEAERFKERITIFSGK